MDEQTNDEKENEQVDNEANGPTGKREEVECLSVALSDARALMSWRKKWR